VAITRDKASLSGGYTSGCLRRNRGGTEFLLGLSPKSAFNEPGQNGENMQVPFIGDISERKRTQLRRKGGLKNLE